MNRLAILIGQGGVETAYKALNIALAGAAMDTEVHVFCTFGGLSLLMKDLHYTMPPELEPFQDNLSKIPGVADLRDMALESGINFIACQMTMDLMSVPPEALIDGIQYAGAAAFLEQALGASSTITF
ncbi:MAG: DsrE/DsrF/DrsH-like family protein [Thermaerobacter sp.]|nr:DsrE/DsrF/DrsH-like family protein [Thermaerobacter sp.]